MKSIALVVGAALVSSLAQAETLSYTWSTSMQMNASTGEFFSTSYLPMFDSGLGTLTGVSLTFGGDFANETSLTNPTSSIQSVLRVGIDEYIKLHSSNNALDELLWTQFVSPS